MIGVVGGIGPYSGINLLQKIFDNTIANIDQDHLDVVLLSMSSKIKDRTEYLLGKVKENPAFAIAEVIFSLEKLGVTVCGVACNTAHAEEIFNVIQFELKRYGSTIKVLNIIDETVSYISSNYPDITKVGVLSTTGTYKFGVYNKALGSKGFKVLVPTNDMQEKIIHPAIYNLDYGIKAQSNPVKSRAREDLVKGVSFLKDQGAQAVILGCTEISLALTEPIINDLITIDPTNVLARALIKNFKPEKLRPIIS